ncbi:Hypothetical protein I595_1755 [Croceitalea dokdonensis DOKDO 023]|uniref:Uncharacterized protein n=1 Tax=Croceitalea dokdonensis DOKDO 023 TaxID=1300341 RepID=A0A0P7AJV5_9FLAO|nr:Hypothetical protein I595_1755 [Croceitalea dokdonensis DOKDO 023]
MLLFGCWITSFFISDISIYADLFLFLATAVTIIIALKEK